MDEVDLPDEIDQSWVGLVACEDTPPAWSTRFIK
jgi:hypothetical protein